MNNYSDDVVERQGIPQHDRGESERPRHVRANPMRGRGAQRGWEHVKNLCSSRSSKGIRTLAAIVLLCVAVLLLWPATHSQPRLNRSLKQDNRSAALLGLALGDLTRDEGAVDTPLSELASSAMHYAQLQRQLSQGFAVSDFYFTEQELATATTLLRKEALSVIVNTAESTRLETIRGRKKQSDSFNNFKEDAGLMDVHQVRGSTPRQARRTPPSPLGGKSGQGTTLETPLRACFIHFLELSDASTQSIDPDELSRLSPQVSDLHRLSVNVRQHLPLMAARYPLIVFHNDLSPTDRLTDGESRMTPTGIALGEAMLQLELRRETNGVAASTARRLMSNAVGDLPADEVDPSPTTTTTEQKEDEGPLLENKATTAGVGGTTRGSIPRNLMGDKRNSRDMDALRRAHIRHGGAAFEKYINVTSVVFDKFGRRVAATSPPTPSQEESLMDIKTLSPALLTRLHGRGKGVVLTMLRRFVFPRSISSPYNVPSESLRDEMERSSVFTQMEVANDGGPHFPEAFRYEGATSEAGPSSFEHHIVPGMYFEPLESPAAAMRSVARKANKDTSGQRKNARHLGDASGDIGSPQISSQAPSLIYTNRSDSFDYSQNELPSFIVPEGRSRWPAPSTPGNGLQFRQRSRFLAIRLMYSRFFRDGEFVTGGSNMYTHRVYARQFDYFFRLDADVFLLGTPLITSLQPPQFTTESNLYHQGRPLVATISEQDVFLTVAEKKAGYGTSMVESASSHQYIAGLWETYNAFVKNETAHLATRASRLGTKNPVGTILSDFSRAISRPEQLPHYVSGVEVVDLNRYRTVALSPRTVALLEMLIPFASTSSAMESPLYSEGSRDLLRKLEASRREHEDNTPPKYPIAEAGEVRHRGSLFNLEEAERHSPKSVLFPPVQWGGDTSREEALLAEQGGGDVDLPPSVERVLRALGGVISEDEAYFEMRSRKKVAKKSAKESHESFMLRYFEKEIKLMKEMEKDNENTEWISKAPTDAESRRKQAKMVQRARVQRAVKEAAQSEQEGRKANHRHEQMLLLGFYIPSAQEATETLGRRLLDRVVDSVLLPDEITTVIPTPAELISQLQSTSDGSWLDLTDTDDGLASQLTKLFQSACDAIETGTSAVGKQYVRLRANAQTKALRRVLTTSPDSLLVMLALYDYVLLYLHLYQLPIHNKRALLVQEFLTRTVDRDAGGIYYNRWGDAEIRTLANSLLLEPSEVVHLDALPIQRGTLYHCPQSTLGGDQSRFSLTQQMSAAVHGAGGLWSFLSSTGESGVRVASPTSLFFSFFEDVTRNIGESASSSTEERVKEILGLTARTPKKVQEEWYQVFIRSARRYVNTLIQGDPSCGSSLYRWMADGGSGLNAMEGLGDSLKSIASGAHASGAGMVSPLRRAVDVLLHGKEGLYGDVRAALKAFELPPAMYEVVSTHEKSCIASASKQEGGSGDPAGQESLLRSREAATPAKGRPIVPGLNAALPQPKPPGTVPTNPVDTPSLSSSLATIAAQLGGGWVRV